MTTLQLHTLPGMFRCSRLACTMRREACAKRWRSAKGETYVWPQNAVGGQYVSCLGCPDGAENAEGGT